MRRLEKTIREIGWTHAVPRLGVRERVSRAFDEMSQEVYDCVLVMDGRRLAGIFTSRDFLDRIAAVRADPAAITLGDVMTKTPCTLRPRDPVAFAINWMAVEGFRNVPIVDDDGSVLGSRSGTSCATSRRSSMTSTPRRGPRRPAATPRR